MAARTGMAKLISELRLMTSTTTNDFSDDQLQDYLDRTREEWRYLRLLPILTRAAGTTQWFDYAIPDFVAGRFEEYAGDGSSGWVVRDGSGNTVTAPPTGYTVNYQARLITFAVDQKGVPYYVDLRAYNLNAAAATIWREKAATVASRVDTQSDNHGISASQEHDHCMRMADHYDTLCGPQVAEMIRMDEI
jgi:hypothetical protein